MPASSASSDVENRAPRFRSPRSWLTAPVDIASLAAFRFLFGTLMALAMVRFLARGWVRELYLEPAFHFTYAGFEWVRPWPAPFMYAHFVLLALLALGIALGFFYRLCVTLFFLGFTYVELLDQTAYLNHYYLISLLSGLLIFLPANRAWSLDAWLKPEIHTDKVAAWCLNILRFQVAVVYVFAGLAKLNADWLFRAQPLRIWLAARSDLPWLGHWLDQLWVAYVASWLGAAFDCSIVFFLLSRRTRKPAFAVLVLFHIATWLLFNIGMFPWIMIIAATLLFPANWPRRMVGRAVPCPPPHANRRSPCVVLKSPTGFRGRPNSTGVRGTAIAINPAGSGAQCTMNVRCHALLLSLLGAYCLIQLALPLRPYLSCQPSAWTCSGFNCAWQVMIAEKTGYAEFYALDPATGHRSKLSLKDYLTPRQEVMMAQDPYLIQAMARRLAADLKDRGAPGQIRVEAYATLNGRPSQPLIRPDADIVEKPPPAWTQPLAR